MSNGPPKLIANEAGVAASNNMHVVTCREHVDPTSFRAIIASWYSTYTKTSALVEGHVLGGGLRKLEPSEAERVGVLVPSDPELVRALNRLLPKVDNLLRESRDQEVSSEIDRLLLNDLLGLKPREVNTLAGFANARPRIWDIKSRLVEQLCEDARLS